MAKKRKDKMDKNSEANKSKEYEDFFNEAELDSQAEEDFVAYGSVNGRNKQTIAVSV